MLYDTNWNRKKNPETDVRKTLLLDAANLIETYGHTKYDVGNKEKGFCLMGAIMAASPNATTVRRDDDSEYLDDCRAWNMIRPLLQDTMTKKGLSDGWSISPIGWNNLSKTTKDEVIDLLRDTADAI